MITSDLAFATTAWETQVGSGVRVTLLSPKDEAWSASVNMVDHDVYHLPEYVSFAAHQEGGMPIAVFAQWGDHWLLIPLILLLLPDEVGADNAGHFDALSPYGYSSPLTNVVQPCDEAGVAGLERAFQTCIHELSRLGVVSLFVRLHPMLPFPMHALTPFERIVLHGDTVFVDLSHSDDELWQQTRASHRRDILAARRRGTVAYIDDDWTRFDEFFEIYHETMGRVQAEEYYLFPKSRFLGLKDAMGDHIHLSVVESEGSVVSAGIVSEVSGIVETHFAGTRDTGLKWSPNKLRIDFLRTWAKKRGNKILHLGGGVGGRRDTLFEFKQGFSPYVSGFHTARLVLNEQAYRDGVARWESANGIRADDIDGYFPPYRKPNA
jgi:hypothetical protein